MRLFGSFNITMKVSGAVFLFLGATVESLLSSEREYILVDHAETFSGAYCYCLEHGTTLAGFRDDTDLEQASSLCPNCSVWIGLYRQGRSWVWVNGDSYTFEHWSPGARSSHSCVVMKNGLWHPERCLQRNPFVCYKGAVGALPLVLRLLLNCRSKPVQADLLTASPQSAKADTSPPPSKDSVTVSWGTVTNKLFSTLAEMNDETSPSVTDDSISASWITVTSKPFSAVTEVLSGSRPELPSSTHIPSSFPLTWEDAQVTSPGFQSNQPISSIQPIPEMTDQSPTIVQENRTWFEAAAACRTRGQLLAGRVALQPGWKAWLGLHRHGLWGSWVWADGSAVEDPQNWGAGEPSYPVGGNCGVGIGTGEGVVWEDECCGVKLYYVCE